MTGLAIIALAVAMLRVPAGAADKGLELRIGGLPTGEIAVQPIGDALRAADLRPGERSRGRLTITNQTAEPSAVRLRAGFEDRVAARSVRISISDRAQALYRGRLSELGEPIEVAEALRPGGSLRLEIEATIDPEVERGWRGAIVEVELELSRGRR